MLVPQRVKLLFLSAFIVLLSGCSSYGVITNSAMNLEKKPVASNYSIKSVISQKSQGEVTLVLAFSGGGTRAAALSHGVLLELENTKLNNGKSLLDEVDVISSVSGGSFTAAYYGLNGKKGLKKFKTDILTKDIESELIGFVIDPANLFNKTGRTQSAINFYSHDLFKGKTFKDLNKPGRPLILINASDLSNGLRFSFVQEYFDHICSDISDLSIGKAVTASSAVPVVFNPVVLQNYRPCGNQVKTRLATASQFVEKNAELNMVINGLSQYENNYPYLHLVDGGITDNLGLRAIYEAIELSGGPKNFLARVNKKQTKHIAVILVDASTKSGGIGINQTLQTPTIVQTIDAISDVQIHRYNTSTIELFKNSLKRWGQELSDQTEQISPSFIQVNFNKASSTEKFKEYNLIPTSLTLTEMEVENLIEAGKNILRNDIDFQNLVREIRNQKE